MNISEMVADSHENAKGHGFYDDFFLMDSAAWTEGDDYPKDIHRIVERTFVLAQLSKIMTEAGEAVQAIQKGKDAEVAEELADVVIRVADLAGFMQIDLENAIVRKMETNRARPYKHGKVC